MQGVCAPSSKDGAKTSTNTNQRVNISSETETSVLASSEASTTDGSPGRRCVIGENNINKDKNNNNNSPMCERISEPTLSHTLISTISNNNNNNNNNNNGCRTSQVMHDSNFQQKEEDNSILILSPSNLQTLPQSYQGICQLPIALLDSVFSYLSIHDLCTVLGVCKYFYRAAVESDRTAWKFACLSLWKSKQGFTQIANNWAKIEKKSQQEELEIIALQQQMLARESQQGETDMEIFINEWEMTRDCTEDEKGSLSQIQQKYYNFQHHQYQQQQQQQQQQQEILFLASLTQRTGNSRRSGGTSFATTLTNTTITCGSDSCAGGVQGIIPSLSYNQNQNKYQQKQNKYHQHQSQNQHLWGTTSLRSTPTYDAIVSTTVSPSLRASFISPIKRSVSSPISNDTTINGINKRNTSGLYWWQLSPEQRQRHLRRLQRETIRNQQRIEEANNNIISMEDDDEDNDNDNDETTEASIAESSRGGTRRRNITRLSFTTTNISPLCAQHNNNNNNNNNSGESSSGSGSIPLQSLSFPPAVLAVTAAQGCTSQLRIPLLKSELIQQKEKEGKQQYQHGPFVSSDSGTSEDNLNDYSKEEEKEEEEEEEESNDDDSDSDSDSILNHRQYINPYQEFEEQMAMTRSISLLQYHAQKNSLRSTLNYNKNKEENNNNNNNINNNNVDEDEEELQLPISWKFAYYMSLRDAQRQRLTMQELIECKWFICFRATGHTHPAIFTSNHTLLLQPPIYTPNGSINNNNNNNNTAAMPALSYQLVKGGTELVVHNFPPLKVHRRLGKSNNNNNNINGNNNNNNNSAANAAARAFLAEPETTLRRQELLAAREEEENIEITPSNIISESNDINTRTTITTIDNNNNNNNNNENNTNNNTALADVNDSLIQQNNKKNNNNNNNNTSGSHENDWGWVIQNYFVKIFSAEMPVPLYIQRLRRTCAPRPP